jgi:hypothetical protein
MPKGFQEVEASTLHEGVKVVSPTHRLSLPLRKYSWYSFLLEAESTPGPQCGRKDYEKKIPVTTSGIFFFLYIKCFII